MTPKIGDVVYTNSAFYIDHGEDDFVGGLATVSKVITGMSAGDEDCVFISVKERPGMLMNWTQYLEPMQDELKEEFKDNWAYMDPEG